MRIGSITINKMSRSNTALWLWLDIRIGKYWYVFNWRKKNKPYLFKSLDGTPPNERNSGSWIFGSYNNC